MPAPPVELGAATVTTTCPEPATRVKEGAEGAVTCELTVSDNAEGLVREPLFVVDREPEPEVDGVKVKLTPLTLPAGRVTVAGKNVPARVHLGVTVTADEGAAFGVTV